MRSATHTYPMTVYPIAIHPRDWRRLDCCNKPSCFLRRAVFAGNAHFYSFATLCFRETNHVYPVDFDGSGSGMQKYITADRATAV